MHTISTFVTENPKQLSIQLSNFEQNVSKETASIRNSYELSAAPVDDDFASPRKTFTVGQCARLDTSGGQVVFNLAPPLDMLPDEFVVVQARGTAGFTAVAHNCKINGAASYTTAAAVVVFRFYFDGTGFWI